LWLSARAPVRTLKIVLATILIAWEPATWGRGHDDGRRPSCRPLAAVVARLMLRLIAADSRSAWRHSGRLS
jgi:hypothetical protein